MSRLQAVSRREHACGSMLRHNLATGLELQQYKSRVVHVLAIKQADATQVKCSDVKNERQHAHNIMQYCARQITCYVTNSRARQSIRTGTVRAASKRNIATYVVRTYLMQLMMRSGRRVLGVAGGGVLMTGDVRAARRHDHRRVEAVRLLRGLLSRQQLLLL